MGAVLTAWLVEIGVRSGRAARRNGCPRGSPCPRCSWPTWFCSGPLAFGAKESNKAAPVCGLLAWGLVAATLVNNPLAPGALSTKLAGGQKGTAPPAMGAAQSS